MSQGPQLRMRHWHPETPPVERPIPPGYTLRPATDADAAALADLLTLSFGDPWDADRARRDLLDHPEVPRTFVVEHDGRLVATASYQLMPEAFPNSGWVHWVGADPAHGGRNLGYAVTREVVLESARAGKSDVGLTTDDPRLPAIRVYLNLGFEPDPWHESHAERWTRVREQLAR